jgi:hypothetical protein
MSAATQDKLITKLLDMGIKNESDLVSYFPPDDDDDDLTYMQRLMAEIKWI